MVFLHLKSRRGFVPAIVVATSLLVVLGAGAAYVVPPLVAAAEQSHAPSCAAVGRSSESADKRGDIFADQIELYERGDLLGIGPAATKNELGSSFAGVAKEAHNDYLATLVERGPIGLLAVATLIAAVIARISGITRRRLPRCSPRRYPCPPRWLERVRLSHSRP